jgi:transposase
VPHSLIRQQVDIRATARTIEIFHRGKRIAVHQRRYGGRRYGTNPEHMPSSHRRYAEWTPARFHRWAASIGPQTEGLIIAILASRPHPEQGFRTCLGVLRLYRDLGRDHAETISARAVEIGGLTCKSIAALITNHKATRAAGNPGAISDHADLRGPGYFH